MIICLLECSFLCFLEKMLKKYRIIAIFALEIKERGTARKMQMYANSIE